MRFLVAFALALALLASGNVDVNAAGPTRIFLPAPPSLIITDSCSFPVRAEFTRNSEYIILFSDSNTGAPRSAIITGALNQRFTNVTSGSSLLVNASGPAFLTFSSDGSVTAVLRGRSTVFVPGRLFVSAGQISIDAAGNITASVGEVTDLCAALS